MRSCFSIVLMVLIVHCSRVLVFSEDTIDSNSGNVNAGKELKPSCQSQIYCDSELMHDVQIARVYPDSKTFVDKKLKFPESEIISKYKKLKEDNQNQVPSKPDLIKFIDENLEVGDELEVWTPTDFTENPSIANKIKDPNYKRWAYDLNNVWKTLGRKVKDDVKTHPELYSLIWVPNGFVIPGGRFGELYYWDTYWIVNGLLLCDMKSTARGVIDNIISLVNKYGFMPNGSRIYYLNRSQPPMLIMMVLSYFKATKDFKYIENIINDLDNEFQFWYKNRTVTFTSNGKEYKMARYNAPSRGPRPESYREDYEMAQKLSTEEEKNNFYTQIKSAAESGWDFSSRWFISAQKSNRAELSHIQTTNIIPVDLNCILHVNALALSVWFKRMGNTSKANEYKSISEQFLNGIQNVMWKKDKGMWFDWDMANNQHREYFYVSNILPLWTGSYVMYDKSLPSSVLRYLKDQHIIESDNSVRFYGTPTSMFASSQQWDFPNAWPPLQAFIIQGLDRVPDKLVQEVAAKMAKVWLYTNYKGFAEKSTMYEKYDVLTAGETGGGGEYTPQTGFGWSNGVVFEFLSRWGDSSTYTSDESYSSEQNNNNFLIDYVKKILQLFVFWK